MILVALAVVVALIINLRKAVDINQNGYAKSEVPKDIRDALQEEMRAGRENRR